MALIFQAYLPGFYFRDLTTAHHPFTEELNAPIALVAGMIFA